jgi:hypothetical protein
MIVIESSMAIPGKEGLSSDAFGVQARLCQKNEMRQTPWKETRFITSVFM